MISKSEMKTWSWKTKRNIKATTGVRREAASIEDRTESIKNKRKEILAITIKENNPKRKRKWLMTMDSLSSRKKSPVTTAAEDARSTTAETVAIVATVATAATGETGMAEEETGTAGEEEAMAGEDALEAVGSTETGTKEREAKGIIIAIETDKIEIMKMTQIVKETMKMYRKKNNNDEL